MTKFFREIANMNGHSWVVPWLPQQIRDQSVNQSNIICNAPRVA